MLDYLSVLKEVTGVYYDFTKLSSSSSIDDVNKLIDKANALADKEDNAMNTAISCTKNVCNTK